ncbi:MAG: hypothetical protein IKX99_01615 [Lachnospiraceae bacterium]|nr:hypothetical protein [Lachnospiraceae bacterium]
MHEFKGLKMEEITYFGLDLSEYYSQISYFRDSMEEPVSISTHYGTEEYLIPTVIAKKPGVAQWFFGEEALSFNNPIKGLLSKAFRKEKIPVEDEEIEATELLSLFIRKVLSMTSLVSCDKTKDYFIICIDHATQMQTDTLLSITDTLSIPREHVKICSKQECFCYYVMNQDPALSLHDSLLMDYWHNAFRLYVLSKDTRITPTVVKVSELQFPSLSHMSDTLNMSEEEMMVHKDGVFLRALDDILGERITSSVYLVGDGFDGNWMNRSKSRLCAGRRVFFGMNLFTKGACYYGQIIRRKFKNQPEYLYLGGGNMLFNVCLKVYNKGEIQLKPLISAGYNYQDALGAMDVIIMPDEEPEITLYCKPIKGGEASEYTFPLKGLVVSENLTTRLRIFGKAASPDRILINIKTLPFGEIEKDLELSWDYEIMLGKSETEEN